MADIILVITLLFWIIYVALIFKLSKKNHEDFEDSKKTAIRIKR